MPRNVENSMMPGDPQTPGKVPGQVADASTGNWVDNYAPAQTRPYLRMMRIDRPIGAWHLMWPCWWSLAFAELYRGASLPNLYYLALFALGSVVMRAAGCIYNDIVDRDIDTKVARTKSRPIPSGQVSAKSAFVLMMALCLVGLLILLQFNTFTIWLGISSCAIVATYPFMKRITNWPQLVLGLAFSWGALVGWSAIHASLAWQPVLLYVACIIWIIGYDTIYAHQDKEDDALIGLGSTALRFGDATKTWLTAFYTLVWFGLAITGYGCGAGYAFAAALAYTAGHFAWQIITLDIHDSDNCLVRFKANTTLGLIVFAGITADIILQAP